MPASTLQATCPPLLVSTRLRRTHSHGRTKHDDGTPTPHIPHAQSHTLTRTKIHTHNKYKYKWLDLPYLYDLDTPTHSEVLVARCGRDEVVLPASPIDLVHHHQDKDQVGHWVEHAEDVIEAQQAQRVRESLKSGQKICKNSMDDIR